DLGCKRLRLRSCQLHGARLACSVIRPGPARLVLGIERRQELLSLLRVPLAPTRGNNVGILPCVGEDHARVRTPGPSQIDVLHAGCGYEPAVTEDEARVLCSGALALGGDEADRVRRAADDTMVEHALAVAKNEVDVALDDAVAEVLPSSRTY